MVALCANVSLEFVINCYQFVLIFLPTKITHSPKIQPGQAKKLNTQTR